MLEGTARTLPVRGRFPIIVRPRLFGPWRRARMAACALWLAGSGCTSLREIPRGEYGVIPERKDVRLVTRAGLKYEFDYMRVEGDTLFGYRRRDVEGPIDEFGTMRVALDDVGGLEARRLDWLRTGLVAAGVVVVVVSAGLIRNRGDQGSSNTGTIKEPIP
jgi:hypothetical protein